MMKLQTLFLILFIMGIHSDHLMENEQQDTFQNIDTPTSQPKQDTDQKTFWENYLNQKKQEKNRKEEDNSHKNTRNDEFTQYQNKSNTHTHDERHIPGIICSLISGLFILGLIVCCRRRCRGQCKKRCQQRQQQQMQAQMNSQQTIPLTNFGQPIIVRGQDGVNRVMVEVPPSYLQQMGMALPPVVQQQQIPPQFQYVPQNQFPQVQIPQVVQNSQKNASLKKKYNKLNEEEDDQNIPMGQQIMQIPQQQPQYNYPNLNL